MKSQIPLKTEPRMETRSRKKMRMMMKKSVPPDRISELPDEIIHLILGSLPSHEEVARTSILSRRWLNLWLSNSYPVVEFQGRGTEEKRFQSFAAATSKRLQLQAVPLLLDSFTISLQHRPTEEEFYKLLSSASIRTDDDNGGRSSPLKVVLIIDCWMKDFLEVGTLLNCGRTKFLHLRGFDLRELHNFKTCLDNLQELTLENVRISQQSFPSFLANARRLEKLRLKDIDDTNILDISKVFLENLQELSLEKVRVSVQSFPSCLANACRLEKLRLKNIYGMVSLDISETVLENLQELILERVKVNKQSFPSCLANARRLEKLSSKVIFGIDMFDVSEIFLENLQELCLEDLQVSQQSFPSCLANARRLEKLSLKAISGIERLDISASNFPSLIYLSFQSDGHYPGLRELQLSSPPLLQTFRFRGDSKLLTVVSAPNVTSLQLAPCAKPTRNEFDELISKFPSLESLDFDARHISRLHNDPNERLRISGHTLRKLTLTQEKRGRNEFEFEIDAPNLVALFIRSDELPNNFYIILAASSTCQCVVDCSISEAQSSTYWSANLRECLESLATQFRHLVFNLNFPPEGYLKVLELDFSKLRWQFTPVPVQHLLLGVDLLLKSAFERADHQTRLLSGILSAFHPKTLLLAQRGENQSLLSYISEQMKKRDHSVYCRNDECWRRRFINTKITSVDDNFAIDKLTSQSSINIILRMSSAGC